MFPNSVDLTDMDRRRRMLHMVSCVVCWLLRKEALRLMNPFLRHSDWLNERESIGWGWRTQKEKIMWMKMPKIVGKLNLYSCQFYSQINTEFLLKWKWNFVWSSFSAPFTHVSSLTQKIRSLGWWTCRESASQDDRIRIGRWWKLWLI